MAARRFTSGMMNTATSAPKSKPSSLSSSVTLLPVTSELASTSDGSFNTSHLLHLLTASSIESIEVKQEGPVKIEPISSFKDAGLHPVMLDNVKLAGYDHPTPIQKFTIPAIVQGRDVIGIAQTGRLLVSDLFLMLILQDPAKPALT